MNSSPGDPPSSSTVAAFPKTVQPLLDKIAKEDFGVSLDRSSTLASPAMAALKEFAESRGLEVPEAALRHSPGDPLADEYDIIKVCQPSTLPSHCNSTELQPPCLPTATQSSCNHPAVPLQLGRVATTLPSHCNSTELQPPCLPIATRSSCNHPAFPLQLGRVATTLPSHCNSVELQPPYLPIATRPSCNHPVFPLQLDRVATILSSRPL